MAAEARGAVAIDRAARRAAPLDAGMALSALRPVAAGEGRIGADAVEAELSVALVVGAQSLGEPQ